MTTPTPTPDLDDRLTRSLHRRADGVTAPPTPHALDRVHHRAGDIRRRRRTHAALAATIAVLAVATVGGGLWLRDGDADLRTGPATSPGADSLPDADPDRLPAFTIDDEAMVPVAVIDDTDEDLRRLELDLAYGDAGDRAHITVERVPEDAAQDLLMQAVTTRTPVQGALELIDVLGRPAFLIEPGSAEPELLWRHTTGDVVDLHLPAAERPELDRLIAGITELDAAAWEGLKDSLADADG